MSSEGKNPQLQLYREKTPPVQRQSHKLCRFMLLSVFHHVFWEINECSMLTFGKDWDLSGETEESLWKQSRKLVSWVRPDVASLAYGCLKGLYHSFHYCGLTYCTIRLFSCWLEGFVACFLIHILVPVGLLKM